MIYELEDRFVRTTQCGNVTQFETFVLAPEECVIEIQTLTGKRAKDRIRQLSARATTG